MSTDKSDLVKELIKTNLKKICSIFEVELGIIGFNKILISNGSSLVIKSEKNNQYYRYPLENTPLNLLLDKKFLIRKMKKLEAKILNNKYYLFSLKENNNSINLFFEKESLNLTGWQTEDIYQNLTITYIYDVEINKPVSKKIFELPKLN